ncbi:MAG TPA: thiamine diphosphokinase [Thermoleophilia bacterium]|nr:thiamine diphosphokinase [Thermoleophilia bacterium]HQG02755.1 thiamine diphosphokinase [Thermoleophilia bacterium]HQJ97072.1 thiamine diphosphokinase [Thermoleophilia bacterium]
MSLAAVFLDGTYEDGDYYVAWALAADLVVAADGGGGFLAAAGLTPDALVGDFDSLDEAAVEEARARGARVVRHPVRKDQTDGELAAAEALRAGAGEIVLAGALGALDHVLGHLALLGRVEAGGTPARLVAPDLTVRVLTAPAIVSLDAAPGTRVSLAPLAGDCVVTLAGFAYPLVRGRLPGDACLGLGNAVAAPATPGGRSGVPLGGQAKIDLHEGRVTVLVASGRESFGGLVLPDLSGVDG